MTDKHILYSFRRCPYAIRARMALFQAGITLELRELVLKDKPADMLKHSPKGTVPVLITVDGTVIDESLDVMFWALKQNDPDQWLSQSSESKRWIDDNDHTFKPLLDKYKYADRHPELTEAQHRENTLSWLETLNKQLSVRPFLLGDEVTVTDVALFPFVRQYAFVNKGWFDDQPWPHLHRWLNHWLNSVVFLSVMKKYPLFNDGHSTKWPE